MPKKKIKDEEERRLRKEESRRKMQESYERCLRCRFFETHIGENGLMKKKCSVMAGRISPEDVCPRFIRRWPEGINPVELLE